MSDEVMGKKIELLDFNVEKKDLYIETMKLINGEVTESQFIKDHLYYEMVKSIYMQSFEELEKNSLLNNNGVYQATYNFGLLDVYVRSAVDTYNKLRDLNKYVGYDFKPFDNELVFYISNQYIKYFYDRKMFLNENRYSFAEKISEQIKEYKHHPFKRVQSNVYNVEEVSGVNVSLNDLIYKCKKKNKDIEKALCISHEDLINIRQGNVILSKDILYALFASLKLSTLEICQFFDRIPKEECLKFFGTIDERDRKILNIVSNIYAFKNVDESNSILDIINKHLIEDGLSPLNMEIVGKKENEREKETKTILLIGGFGFIGMQCIKNFLNDDRYNYNICVLSKNVPKELPENIVCYQGDITNPLVYERILSENNVDYIINLAAISTVNKGDEALSDTLMINEQAPNSLYNTILENKFPVKCVIFPSTVQVYQGVVNDDKYRENSLIDPNKKKNDYAFSKYQAEQNSLRYAKKGVPIIITRLSNIYGNNDNNKRLIPETLKSIKNNENPKLYMDELGRTASINLLYVDDLISAFKQIFYVMEEKPIFYDENNPYNIVVNIANDVQYSVREIVEKMYNLAGISYEPVIVNTKIQPSKEIDVSKLKEKFGFDVKYDLEKGLLETMGDTVSKEKSKVLRRDK